MTKPIETIRDGAISIAIWKNSSENGSFYSVTFERTYTDSEGAAASSSSLGPNDMLKLLVLIPRAYSKIGTLRAHDKIEQENAA